MSIIHIAAPLAVPSEEFTPAGPAPTVGDAGPIRAGDAAYFPPHTRGVWTIHEKLRKTYVIWR
jgi:hypothetical protein